MDNADGVVLLMDTDGVEAEETNEEEIVAVEVSLLLLLGIGTFEFDDFSTTGTG